MATGWYPKAKRLPITTDEFFRPRGADIEGIVDHITDGTDSRDFLQNADNGSSVHFLIRIEDGEAVVYQFMPVEWAAWGNGRFSQNNPFMPAWIKSLVALNININRATISIEHERKWPFTTSLPEPMLSASIALHKWLADNYPTIRRDREHIMGHYQIDHVDRANCPGGAGGLLFPFDTILDTLNSDEPLMLPHATHAIEVPKFKAFYLAEPKALSFWGLPIEDSKEETLSDGETYLVQYFERARFELHPEGVILGLLGVEALA